MWGVVEEVGCGGSEPAVSAGKSKWTRRLRGALEPEGVSASAALFLDVERAVAAVCIGLVLGTACFAAGRPLVRWPVTWLVSKYNETTTTVNRATQSRWLSCLKMRMRNTVCEDRVAGVGAYCALVWDREKQMWTTRVRLCSVEYTTRAPKTRAGTHHTRVIHGFGLKGFGLLFMNGFGRAAFGLCGDCLGACVLRCTNKLRINDTKCSSCSSSVAECESCDNGIPTYSATVSGDSVGESSTVGTSGAAYGSMLVATVVLAAGLVDERELVDSVVYF